LVMVGLALVLIEMQPPGPSPGGEDADRFG
jgi:hypothetical protein